ncbi:MAG: ABC transporter substrate-binding protein [bacterium]|nr:ABC transporter substrate-binding protein [bacterium]
MMNSRAKSGFRNPQAAIRNLTWCLLFFLLILPFGCGQVLEGKDILRVRLSTDPTTLDPALAVDVASGVVTAKIFNGLVRYNELMEIVPDLAKEWQISDDGLLYTFHLREGIKFSNGQPVTAKDVKYSFARLLDPKTRSPRTWVLDRIKGAKVVTEGRDFEVDGITLIDTDTIRLELSAPFAPFLGLLAMPAGYIVPKAAVERWGEDFSTHVVGTGPFKLVEWRQGERILLLANSDYFDTPPRIAGLEYKIIPEDLTALAEFETERLDVLGLPTVEQERFLQDPAWQPYILHQVGLNVYYLGLNCQSPPLDRLKVRQALNYAINKEAILRVILKGKGALSHGPVPPGLPGYNKKVEPYPYNLDRARKLLAEAGLPEGFSMKIYQTSNKEVLNITEVMQAQLKQVGITAEKIVQLEWSAYKEAITKGEADAFYLAWIADYPDAENFLFPLFHSDNWGAGGNRARYKNKAVDILIEAAQQTTDPEQRLEIYEQLEAMLHTEAPWVFLWHKAEYVVHQPWVKDYKLSPIYNADKGTEVRLIRE